MALLNRDKRLYCRLMRLSVVLLVAAVITSCRYHELSAQTLASNGTELAAAVNVVPRNVKVEGVLWMPPTIARIQAVFVVMSYGLTLSGPLYESALLRAALRDTNSAVLQLRVSYIMPPASNVPAAEQVLRNAAVGGGDALLSLMQRFAEESDRPELTTSPMLFWGWSAAASFGSTFANLHPDRTIGIIRYHTRRLGLEPNLKLVKNIPVLIIAGRKDTTAGTEDAIDLWKMGRSSGAPWTLAIEPEAPHYSAPTFDAATQHLIVPWVAGVLRRHVAERAGSGAAPWWADHQTGNVGSDPTFDGDKASASWLPDESSARGWARLTGPTARADAPP